MDDLIFRQDAINEFSYCQTYLFDSIDRDPKISLEDAKYAIEQLPSAQQWIPCSERLPDEGVNVLTQGVNGNMITNRIIDGKRGWWFWDDEYVAWMPLPEPYKGVQHE